MVKATSLFLLPLEEEKEFKVESSSQLEVDIDVDSLNPAPYWSRPSSKTKPSQFPTRPHHYYEAGDRVTRSLDLFDVCPPPETTDTSDFGGLDSGVVDAMSADYLGLGPGLDVQEPDHNQVEDCGDGLRVVGFDVNSEEGVPNWQDQDTSLPPFCCDSVQLEEERRDFDVDFEWEEADGRADESDLLSIIFGGRSRSSEADEDEEEGLEDAVNVDWEGLLAVSNIDVEDGNYINPIEYDGLFEQFADHHSAIRGSLPAAKSVVANLPSVVLTQEAVAKNNAICAVCMDDISLEETVRQVLCLHHYHRDCILPWLKMRNTCPVCRFELLTDDFEYESWNSQRRVRNNGRYTMERPP